jgi:hypothetical protein
VTNYFLYGETIVYYFKHIILVDAYVLPFAQRHRFISFILYIIGPFLEFEFPAVVNAYLRFLGFVGFVASLKRNQLRRQFGLFCWIHMSLFLIVLSRYEFERLHRFCIGVFVKYFLAVTLLSTIYSRYNGGLQLMHIANLFRIGTHLVFYSGKPGDHERYSCLCFRCVSQSDGADR